MKIGVDATVWLNQRGYGRYARALLSALAKTDKTNQYVFVVDADTGLENIPPEVGIRIVKTSRPTVDAASADGRRSIADLYRMGKALSAKDFDVLLFPTIYSYVPVWSRARKIIIIHDVIPEFFPQLTLPNLATRFFWNTKSTLARMQSDVIVTVSDYSKYLITKKFHIPATDVYVVGEASESIFCKLDNPILSNRLMESGISETDRFLVFVGGFGPHKNLATLLTAFSAVIASPENSDVKLVFVGEYKKEAFYSAYNEISQQINESGMSQSTIFTGYLPDADLAILLNRAQALVLPSLMEGFGLPAVEAAACGCPVIATTASPLPELLGGAGIYFNPLDLDGLKIALGSVLGSKELREQMGQVGLCASANLTWEKAAAQMKSIIDLQLDS